MDREGEDDNIYDLITQLIKHTLQQNRLENENSYVPPRSDVKIVKSLRSKAYEILLNKSNKICHRKEENAAGSEIDPLVEISKHAFVLKLALRRLSEAEELEKLINELYAQENSTETTYHPILQLLVELKSFQTNRRVVLDVFHYGKNNPSLPEDVAPTKGVPMFQTYPMESFNLPEKFEAMLGIRRTYTKQNTWPNFVSGIPFKDQYVSRAILGIETIRYNNVIEMTPCISSCIENTAKQCNMISPLLTHITIEQTNKLYLSTQGFISNMTSPYEWMKSVDDQIENQNHLRVMPSDNSNFTIESENVRDQINLMWKEILSSDYISKLRTWESLGAPQSPKQSLFVTDLPETALHLARIKQTSILSLLPKKAMRSVSLMREVPLEKFLSDVKLLLFGVDSDSFKYDTVTGFKLEKNVTVRDVSPEALDVTCQEVICWGNSFKSLLSLVTPDPQTGKLKQDGLIFKAMCTNVKELLLYYRSALQRILNRHEFHGLLSLFKKVRPLAHLIVEVERLCGCSRDSQCTLAGGSRILTHIYKEVTKVTNPKIALVFYSILKSCCEVYFRLLQNWLFEGTCDDVYGEFMIQVRSHYLRKRGRKFWTEGFAVDTESVPGFLSELSESILQCGKTLRLLKICSLKNPVCNVSFNAQPEVRVCLSVSMLREQLLRCQEYEEKGEEALGPIVSLLSAIQDEKRAEKETAELVIRAQQETLSRLNKQREELLIKAAQRKREFLQELKQQAEESALFKEKEKEFEMLTDKLLLEKINREQDEQQEQQQAERELLIQYYDKLAADIESNHMRSNWRKARMNHFERRVEFLKSLRKFDREALEIATPSSEENTVDIDNQNKTISASSSMDISEAEPVSNQDEDSNFAENEVLHVATSVSNHKNLEKNLSAANCVDTDASRTDNVLDEEITLAAADTQNARLPQKSQSLNYIYKKNNERSNLQDFLRDEATKNINTIIEAEAVSNQDENSNFAENEVLGVATNVSDQKNLEENLSAANCVGVDASPVESDNSDKVNVSDKEITSSRDTTANMQNVRLPQKSQPLNYIYKKNNERSNLQDFLRDEATKNINTIIDKQTAALDTCLNILETDEVTEKIKGAINRPKSLTIERIDNMTTAQANKLRVLMQEYGMTPNNNELRDILAKKQAIIDRTNINGNKQTANEQSSDNMKENMNNNAPSIPNVKLPTETASVGGSTNNEECSNKINKAQEPILDNMQQQSNMDTPMSCTTDNFTTLSTHTPLSQIPNSDDIFALNASQEMLSEMTKSITEETCCETPMSGNFKFVPNLLDAGHDVRLSSATSSLTIADVEMIDHTSLQVYLEKSVIIPLQIQTRLVNNAIIKYLVNECNMLSHLHSLRSYFFLLNGEFAKSLTDSLYSHLYAISTPIELFNSATLTNLLDKALMNSFSNNYANSELLSLTVIDKPSQLYISDPNVLECLCLNYKISWPLNIILDDTMMSQYSKVFKFLIMTGRMSWVLQEDFNIMKVERNAVNSEQYHKLQLYRHSMTQFMNALDNYLTCSVLHASWSEFEKDLQNSLTIDQIYLSHMNYIKRILSRCMLNTRGEKMRVCLSNVFKIILKFHNRLRSQSWTVNGTGQYSHPNFKSLEHMYQSFCEWRTYMAHVAHKLATSGYQPHLTHFLNALNINHMYDLTMKQQ